MKPLPKFTVVVHTKSIEQTLEQATVALENGAGGLFLIAHHDSCGRLGQRYQAVRGRFPDAWIGVNFLDLDPFKAVDKLECLCEGSDGLWVDDCGIHERTHVHSSRSSVVNAKMLQWHAEFQGKPEVRGWRLFGSVAFKYQSPVTDLERIARWAASRVDVVTTSGDATGVAPDVSKVRRMKGAVGEHPLALASGMTCDNIESFMPYVDCFMVATGVSKTFHELDPLKVRMMANMIETLSTPSP